MKQFFAASVLIPAVTAAMAQGNNYRYTEASGLTMVGKLMPDAPNLLHRVDTVKFKGFTHAGNGPVRMSAGTA